MKKQLIKKIKTIQQFQIVQTLTKAELLQVKGGSDIGAVDVLDG